MANSSKTVHSALDTILTRRLAPKHITALVEEIVSGKSAETFDPKIKRTKSVRKNRDVSGQLTANNNGGNEGSATWALLDYLVEVGVKPTDLRGVYFELMAFHSSAKNRAAYLKELRIYLENIFEYYGVNVKIK